MNLNPGHGNLLTGRNTVGKDKSILDLIQELQLKIQSFGSGPYPTEQQLELEKIKTLYVKAKQEYDKQLRAYELTDSMASSAASSVNTPSSSQPISLVGTMGLVQNTQQQIHQSILQGRLTPQQISAFQAQQGATPQQQVGGMRPVVNLVGNHQNVAALQNVQVLGSAAHHQDGIGNVPINIITTGGQTYAVTSNLQYQIASQSAVPTQMQIRSIAPNAATVVNQLQANHLTVQQIRGNVQQQQQRIQTVGTPNTSTPVMNKTVQQVNLSLPLQGRSQSPATAAASATSHNQILTKRKLQDLLHEIDPTETMDDDVEEVLLQIADDFIENVIKSSCQIAKHRKSNTLEVKDVQLHLDRNWNMWIPGFGSEDLRPYKKLPSTEAHRQRLALIKKAMKK